MLYLYLWRELKNYILLLTLISIENMLQVTSYSAATLLFILFCSLYYKELFTLLFLHILNMTD